MRVSSSLQSDEGEEGRGQLSPRWRWLLFGVKEESRDSLVLLSELLEFTLRRTSSKLKLEGFNLVLELEKRREEERAKRSTTTPSLPFSFDSHRTILLARPLSNSSIAQDAYPVTLPLLLDQLNQRIVAVGDWTESSQCVHRRPSILLDERLSRACRGSSMQPGGVAAATVDAYS